MQNGSSRHGNGLVHLVSTRSDGSLLRERSSEGEREECSALNNALPDSIHFNSGTSSSDLRVPGFPSFVRRPVILTSGTRCFQLYGSASC